MTKEEIIERCIAICDFFIEKNVKAIVIACNTATSVAAPILRKKYTNCWKVNFRRNFMKSSTRLYMKGSIRLFMWSRKRKKMTMYL